MTARRSSVLALAVGLASVPLLSGGAFGAAKSPTSYLPKPGARCRVGYSARKLTKREGKKTVAYVKCIATSTTAPVLTTVTATTVASVTSTTRPPTPSTSTTTSSSTTTTTAPSAVPTLTSPAGNLYRAGEFCPAADLGLLDNGGDGLIKCADDAGYDRWVKA